MDWRRLLNMLDSVQRGKENTKGGGALRWNEAQELYLKVYSPVDKVDQMLKEWHINYISRKWWRAPMCHGKAIVMCMTYQIYCECGEGELDKHWNFSTPMTAGEFCDRLEEQMCKYCAADMHYPGNDTTRVATIKPRKRRRSIICSVHTSRRKKYLRGCEMPLSNYLQLGTRWSKNKDTGRILIYHRIP